MFPLEDSAGFRHNFSFVFRAFRHGCPAIVGGSELFAEPGCETGPGRHRASLFGHRWSRLKRQCQRGVRWVGGTLELEEEYF